MGRSSPRSHREGSRVGSETNRLGGRRINDPRSLGFGLQVQAWVALLGDSYSSALNLTEAASDVARVDFDRESIKNIKNTVPVLLRWSQAHQMLHDWMNKYADNNCLTALDGICARQDFPSVHRLGRTVVSAAQIWGSEEWHTQ